MHPIPDPTEMYGQADRRLRLLLLGDGTDTPGLVKGEELRRRVTAELRHLRDAFNAVVSESDKGRAGKEEAQAVDLEEELRMIASVRSRAQELRSVFPALLTPVESAQVLGLSVSSIYRLVRNGELRAVRPTEKKRGALRIPATELQRLLEANQR